MTKVAYSFELDDAEATVVSLLPLCAAIVRRALGLTPQASVHYTPRITGDDRLQLVVSSPQHALITGRLAPGVLTVTVEDTMPVPQPRVPRMGRIVERPAVASDPPLFYAAPAGVGQPPQPAPPWVSAAQTQAALAAAPIPAAGSFFAARSTRAPAAPATGGSAPAPNSSQSFEERRRRPGEARFRPLDL